MSTWAQVEGGIDSSRKDSSVFNEEIYVEKFRIRRVYLPFELHLDSVIRDTVPALRKIHIRDSWELYRSTTGNSFSPGYSLKLDDPIRIGPRLGFDSYLYRTYLDEEDVHFQSDVPLTNIFYSLGTKGEQEFDAVHIHSFSPRFDFGIRLKKQNAPGFYSGDRTNRSYFAVTTHWNSQNLHWQNETYYKYTGMQFGQNGGIYTDTAYDERDFENLRLFETPFAGTNLQTLRNFSDWNDTHAGHIIGTKIRYIPGAESIVYDEDSLQKSYSIKPKNYFEFGIENETQKYNMYYSDPDSSALATLAFDELRTLDTLGTNSKLQNYSATVAYAFPFSQGVYSSAIRIFGGYTLSVFDQLSNKNNFSIGADFHLANRLGFLKAQTQIYLAGANAGDVRLGADAVFDWKKIHNQLNFSFIRSSSPYFYDNAKYYNLTVSNNLKSETHQNLDWRMRYKFLKFNLGIRSYFNYIYLQESDTNLNTFHNREVLMNVYYLGIGLELKGDVFGTDINVYLQRVPSDFPLSAPALISNSQFYVHDAWFQNKLFFYTGFQLDVSSRYEASPYDLFYNQFSSATSPTIDVMRLNLQFFFDFQISRAKLFLKLGQINQLFTSNYNLGVVRDYTGNQGFNYIGSPNLNLHFGVSWLMIN